MRTSNKDRILEASVELFNHSGTVATTTNHIAAHLRLSPGNLYFHFRNKEEIVRILFERMCDEIYQAWSPGVNSSPQSFVESSFEIFWKYRFFHREMYHLRRQDAALSRAWKRHLRKCYLLVKRNYRVWLDGKAIRPVNNTWELKVLTETILLSSTSYLTFFESPEKMATRKSIRVGMAHMERLLAPYAAMRTAQGSH